MKKQMLFVITGDIKTIKEIYDTFKYVSQFTHFFKKKSNREIFNFATMQFFGLITEYVDRLFMKEEKIFFYSRGCQTKCTLISCIYIVHCCAVLEL